jgi:hypothetical protein
LQQGTITQGDHFMTVTIVGAGAAGLTRCVPFDMIIEDRDSLQCHICRQEWKKSDTFGEEQGSWKEDFDERWITLQRSSSQSVSLVLCVTQLHSSIYRKTSSQIHLT